MAPRAVPHYDSSAMDGWAVAGPPPWRIVEEDVLVPGQARTIVTGGVLPLGSDAVVPLERGSRIEGLLDAQRPAAGAHVRHAGEEAAVGTVLVPAGTRLSPAHLAVLAIAGLDAVVGPPAAAHRLRAHRRRGDDVGPPGRRARPGRVRPPAPARRRAARRVVAAPRSASATTRPRSAAAIDALGAAEVVVTVGGTGRSRADRLREAIDGRGADVRRRRDAAGPPGAARAPAGRAAAARAAGQPARGGLGAAVVPPPAHRRADRSDGDHAASRTRRPRTSPAGPAAPRSSPARATAGGLRRRRRRARTCSAVWPPPTCSRSCRRTGPVLASAGARCSRSPGDRRGRFQCEPAEEAGPQAGTGTAARSTRMTIAFATGVLLSFAVESSGMRTFASG